MTDRPMTNKELREALAIAENNIKSLKADLTKQREKYRAAKKECHRLRNQRNTYKAELDRALFEKQKLLKIRNGHQKEPENAKYVRYRFKTKSVGNPHPQKDFKLIGMPYWIRGYVYRDPASIATNLASIATIIVCYLPKGVDLKEYWEDAFEIDTQECSEITYTPRFPKPDWLP